MRLRHGLFAALQTGAQLVAPPAGFTWTLPFSIYRGGIGAFTTNLNLQTYAGITVSKTYYVNSATGNDGNTGLSWAQAFKTLNQVETQGDADRVYIANGSYFLKTQRPKFTRSMELIGVGTVTITSDVADTTAAFSLVDSHYVATISEYIAQGRDETNLDSFGCPIRLTSKDTIAEVDAAANSIYVDWTGRKVYVRLFDSRVPDASLKLYDSVSFNHNSDGITLYIENITFKPGATFGTTSAAGGTKAYCKNCTFSYLSIAGTEEVILQNCTVYGWALTDNINIGAASTINPQVAEIDCLIYNAGAGATNQCSTGHQASKIVRVNGKYHDCGGQCVADVDDCEVWMLGSELYNSTTGIGVYSGGTHWLDTVWSHDNATYDLQNEVGSTIYTHNCTLEKGSNDIAGTLTPY